jgi:hypothetical protein
MADRVMFISWTATVPGREERGLEVFNEALGLYGRLQQEGKIESFDVALMDPNGTLDGYIQVRGSAEQLAAVRASDDYRRNMVDAGLITVNLAVTEGSVGEGVARDVALYQEALGKVPQHA